MWAFLSGHTSHWRRTLAQVHGNCHPRRGSCTRLARLKPRSVYSLATAIQARYRRSRPRRPEGAIYGHDDASRLPPRRDPARPLRVARPAPRRCSTGRRISRAAGWAPPGCCTSTSSIGSRSAPLRSERSPARPPSCWRPACPGTRCSGPTTRPTPSSRPATPTSGSFSGAGRPSTRSSAASVDASIQAGYNLAAEGPDGEVALARRQGRLRVLGAFRLLAAPGDDGGTDVAVAGGAAIRLTRGVALAADVATLTERAPGEDVAWSAGVNLIIPHTPHSLSLHATNTNNATLAELLPRHGRDSLRLRVHDPGDAEPLLRRWGWRGFRPAAGRSSSGGRRSRHRHGRGGGLHVPAGAARGRCQARRSCGPTAARWPIL